MTAVSGSRDLARLGARLKAAGERDLRLQLLRRLRAAGKELIPPIERSAREVLPKTGGLAERVASQKLAVRTSFAASGARVRLIDQGMQELSDIDKGRVRHPVYGNRSVWKQQEVEPGFFTKPVEEGAPVVRENIRQAMEDISRQITRGI